MRETVEHFIDQFDKKVKEAEFLSWAAAQLQSSDQSHPLQV